jgi:hypothetical protein
MNPGSHLLYVQLSRTFTDSPEHARRRDILRERDLQARTWRAQRRRELLRRARAVVAARLWGYDRGLATGPG